jgi:hypothetical protein
LKRKAKEGQIVELGTDDLSSPPCGKEFIQLLHRQIDVIHPESLEFWSGYSDDPGLFPGL